MRKLVLRVRQFFSDQRAAEVTELAIVLALVVAGAIATIVVLGPKVAQMYQDTNSKIP